MPAFEPFEDVKPGDPIRADDINDMRMTLRGLSRLSAGDDLEMFSGPLPLIRGIPVQGTVMVRITHDVYPEGSAEFVAAYGPFDTTLLPQDLQAAATTHFPDNAMVQVYNPEINAANGPTGWIDDPDSQTLYLTNYGPVPLVTNDVIPVYFDRGAARWLPQWQILSNTVRVSSATINGAGFYDGYIQVYNMENTPPTVTDGTQVHCQGPNAETLMVTKYTALRIGHKSGRGLFNVMIGGAGGSMEDVLRLTSGSPDSKGRFTAKIQTVTVGSGTPAATFADGANAYYFDPDITDQVNLTNDDGGTAGYILAKFYGTSDGLPLYIRDDFNLVCRNVGVSVTTAYNGVKQIDFSSAGSVISDDFLLSFANGVLTVKTNGRTANELLCDGSDGTYHTFKWEHGLYKAKV